MAGLTEFQFAEEVFSQIGNSAEMRSVLRTLGERVQKEAEDIARREIADNRPHFGGPRYVDAFHTEVGRIAGAYLEALVANDAYDAVWVEKGAHAGGRTPVLGLHVLERALGNTGGAFGG